jgi:mono/diheme cytochrome c family protein
MLKKLFLLAVAAAIVGAAVFWIVTRPAVVSAASLPAYTPNVANGQTVFNIGGCASCHAVKGEARTALGGGLAIESPFGTFYVPNISPHKQNSSPP